MEILQLNKENKKVVDEKLLAKFQEIQMEPIY
jgi:hypothetical protein